MIDEAVEKKCDMIITHHPMIFKSIKNVNSGSVLGRRIIKLIKNDIAVYSAHTNLDIAKGGTNDTFADLLGLKDRVNLCESVGESGEGLGKVGELEREITFAELISKVKDITKLDKLAVSGDMSKSVKRIGIGTGSCCKYEYFKRAKDKGCDAYISADMGYHEAQSARELELCVIDATHYASEVLVIPVICRYLEEKCGGSVRIIQSEINGHTFEIV
ncbi:MAG: Nif3-like dinuclear metal center hexameric protein [Firmicutes bacterium]|nr:Nif3-like dinuclear metal center hexameric protein [Bacillota bacterium]